MNTAAVEPNESGARDFATYLAETDPAMVLNEAEQSVLGAQLLFPDMLGQDWLPRPADYGEADHREIASAIAACAAAGAVDPITVFDYLQAAGKAQECGGLTYLNGLAQSVPSRGAIKSHAAIVRRKAYNRRAAGARAQAAALLKGSSDTSEVLPEVLAILGQLDDAGPTSGPARHAPRPLDFKVLASQKAPPKSWLRPGWLGADDFTLLAAKGGDGKSTLSQHEATCAALGRPYFTAESPSYRSLIWNCEDGHDDLWRRQQQICEHEQIDMADLADSLHLISRRGCENALMAEVRSGLVATRLLEELRQQVNDLKIDTLWLDNAAHFFLGNHDDRTQVTQFINSLALVQDRPFSVVLTAHVSRAQGSEYSGSVAWENAARMRWYLGSQLPDQKPGDEEGEDRSTSVRYLCKRKANYTARDYVRFTMREGLLIPDQAAPTHVGAIVSALDERRAEEVCIAGFKSLCAMGIRTTDGKTSPDYLPSQMAAKGLAMGYSKFDIGRAMNRLMGRGMFVRAPVGQHSNRSQKFGLVLQEGQA